MNNSHPAAALFSICLAVLTLPCYGQTSVSLDNDLLAASGSDSNYTGGLRITHRVNPSTTWQTGILLYTPENLTSRQTQLSDRPYANLLFVARSKERFRTRSINRFTMSGGIIGSRVGRALHRTVHRLTGSETPDGYRNQISDGGEPTIRVGWTRYSVLLNEPNRPGNLTLAGESSISVGYRTDASIGLAFKLSKLPDWWGNARHSFLNKLDEPDGPTTPGLFGGVRLTATGYNALLQGQFRPSAHAVDSSRIRRLVGEIWLGFSARFKGMNVSYTLRGSSPDFDGAGNTVWASINLAPMR